jgi:hypothetical protein
MLPETYCYDCLTSNYVRLCLVEHIHTFHRYSRYSAAKILYVFVYTLFNDAVSSSELKGSTDLISE